MTLTAASLATGGYDISAATLQSDPRAWSMVFISRIPRTAALVLAAVAMGLSGVIMQLLTQNRFVEPTTAGTSQWAGLGILVGFLVFPGEAPMFRMLLAVLFAFVGTLIFLALLRRVRHRGSAIVPLVGIMLGALVGSCTVFLAVRFDLLQSIGAWQSGGFSDIVRGFYEPLFAIIAVAIATVVLADRFSIAGLGRDVATSLGLRYGAVLLLGTSIVALAVGVTSVVVGFLPFLGLIAPNVVAMVLGDNLRRNIPWIAVLSVILLVGCDLIGRTVVAPMEIPASVILGALGAALFVGFVIVMRRRVIA